jgi:hypothetical protein
MSKVYSVNTCEMLRECMKMVANAWSLAQALDALDEWTLAQVGCLGLLLLLLPPVVVMSVLLDGQGTR